MCNKGVNRRMVFECCDGIWGAVGVCAGDWVVLRVGDADGGGGLMAVKMIKYTTKNECVAAVL